MRPEIGLLQKSGLFIHMASVGRVAGRPGPRGSPQSITPPGPPGVPSGLLHTGIPNRQRGQSSLRARFLLLAVKNVVQKLNWGKGPKW